MVTAALRTPLISCESVTVEVADGRARRFALAGLTLEIDRGALMPLLGPAGAGKTALLDVLAGLRRPTAGTVGVDGLALDTASDGDLVEYRRESVGYVAAGGTVNLVPWLDVEGNAALPLRLAGEPRGRTRRRVRAIAELLRLEDRLRTSPARLTRAEVGRAAIAAALACGPALLLLDEPAAGLDDENRDELIDLLRAITEQLDTTVLLATRDETFARRVGRFARLEDGRAVSELVHQVAYSRGGGEQIEELALLDGAGRVVVPADARERLGLGRRVRVTEEGDHLEVRPERPPPDPTPPWRRRS